MFEAADAIGSELEVLRDERVTALAHGAIRRMTKDELLQLQASLGLGSRWGQIIVPAKLRPANKRAFCERSCDLRKSLPEGVRVDSEIGRETIEMVLRASLVNYLYTNSATWGGHARIAISTLLIRTRTLTRLAREALEQSGGTSVLHPLNYESLSRALKSDTPVILKILREYQERALLDEFPVVEVDSISADEASRKGKSQPLSSTTGPEEYKPFPDEFVGQVGWRCLWLSKELGPALLDCAEEIHSIEAPNHWGIVTQETGLPLLRKTFLNAYLWKGSSDTPIEALPFDFAAASKWSQRFGVGDSWKPRIYADLKRLLMLLQATHLFLVLLTAGSRIGEIASLRESCLVESPDGTFRVDGRTYKLVGRDGGEVRDWPLPDDLVKALLQQQRLARIVKAHFPHANHIEQDALWVPIRRGPRADLIDDDEKQDAYPSFNSSLNSLVKSFGLTHLAGDKNPHPHRFRKTLARLIGLALVGSPKILMDLFGHKSIEMALKYIHSDKNLRAEIEEVSKGQIIMFAEGAIQSAEENGGAASRAVRRAVEDLRARRGDHDLEIEDIHDLAKVLTLGGQSWQLVRPGVICTKSVSEFGACTRSAGRPNPSSCKTLCDFRLEQASYREEVDGSIAETISHLERAFDEVDEMAIGLWTGQLLAHLPRFEDLQLKWQRHPTVQKAMESEIA